MHRFRAGTLQDLRRVSAAQRGNAGRRETTPPDASSAAASARGWSHGSESNRRPAVYETAALPTELPWPSRAYCTSILPGRAASRPWQFSHSWSENPPGSKPASPPLLPHPPASSHGMRACHNGSMLVIDTHAHLYSPDEGRYPPRPNPARPPQGTGTIEHLRREMKSNGVDGICAVQVGGFYRFDNRFICDVSKAHPDWIAGICTLDPNDPHSPGLLAQFARDYGIRGMRSVAAAGRQLDHPGVRALWKTALASDIVINLLIGHELAGPGQPSAGRLPRTAGPPSTTLWDSGPAGRSRKHSRRCEPLRGTRTATRKSLSSPTARKAVPAAIRARASTRL